jgi:exodeoxyribonuclease VII large subunit
VPHIPVVLIPALVQGAAAPQSMVTALRQMYAWPKAKPRQTAGNAGGGRDLAGARWWLDGRPVGLQRRATGAHHCAKPGAAGQRVGHETDFTIADFCADLRAPTPTAAAELVAQPREVWLGALDLLADRLESAVQRQLDLRHQRLDQAAQRLGRPSGLAAREQLRLAAGAAPAPRMLLNLSALR